MPLDPRTRVTAISSEDDAIVPAEAARSPGHTNHVVRGSHSGLASNGLVYRHLAAALAARDAPEEGSRR
jgi:hypothetical protein